MYILGFVFQSRSSGDTEAGALMFGSLYFILIKYQLWTHNEIKTYNIM